MNIWLSLCFIFLIFLFHLYDKQYPVSLDYMPENRMQHYVTKHNIT